MKTSKLIFVAALVMLAGQVGAQQQTVEDQKAVLDAQIELVKKKRDLQNELRNLGGSSSMGLPVVVSVTIGSQRVARLQLPNGIVGHYREDEMIRPGMVVSSIAPKQVFVKVSSGKRAVAVPLDFAGPAMSGPGQVPALPGQNVPDALLPKAPDVTVPAIEVIPDAKPVAAAAAAAVKAGK